MQNPFHNSQRGFLPATLAWVLFYLGMILALPSANAMETQSLCARAIGDAEQTPRLSTALLTAIAQTESGRWDACPEAISAWPWTVTNGPDGRFFPTKSECPKPAGARYPQHRCGLHADQSAPSPRCIRKYRNRIRSGVIIPAMQNTTAPISRRSHGPGTRPDKILPKPIDRL